MCDIIVDADNCGLKGEGKTFKKIKVVLSVSVTRDCFALCKPLPLVYCKKMGQAFQVKAQVTGKHVKVFILYIVSGLLYTVT